MLRNSSQFFRVSNTREDFHTSTRRCSKLFAFLGPAKARKSADLEHVWAVRNKSWWNKTSCGMEKICWLCVCLFACFLGGDGEDIWAHVVSNAIITYVVIIPPVNWVVPQEAHSPPSSPWRSQLGKFTCLVELWTWLWATVPQQETRFCHVVFCLGMFRVYGYIVYRACKGAIYIYNSPNSLLLGFLMQLEIWPPWCWLVWSVSWALKWSCLPLSPIVSGCLPLCGGWVLVGVAAFLGSEVVLSPVVSGCLPSCGGRGVVGVAASRTKIFRNQNHRFQSKFAYCKLFGVYAGVIIYFWFEIFGR